MTNSENIMVYFYRYAYISMMGFLIENTKKNSADMFATLLGVRHCG